MNKLLIFIVVALSFSCNSQKNVNSSQAVVVNDTLQALHQLDSLDVLLKQAYQEDLKEIPTALIEKTIQAQKDFVFRFPQHKHAPESLDKVHQLYGQLGNYQFAVEYGEMLLSNYPTYRKINPLKYSLASSYDYFLDNPEKAIKLYKELLEDKTISDDARNEISERLKQINK